MATATRTNFPGEGRKVRLELDKNEWNALLSALNNYTGGRTMPIDDEDEPVLDHIYDTLAEVE